MWKPSDFEIPTLGEARVNSEDVPGLKNIAAGRYWVDDDERVPYQCVFKRDSELQTDLAFEKAGARHRLFFNPGEVNAGIVTCGGICPGLNDVIRALYMELHYIYHVKSVTGFRYGLRGLDPSYELEPIILNHERVSDIQAHGGTMLGTSRGHVDVGVVVDTLVARNIHMLFIVGGDGSQRAAHGVWQEIERRGLNIAIVGVPKTIDNDINFVYKTFGFDTAVSFARDALDAAHIEAKGNPNGIGLVKVMGRDSGFIASYATLASITVNYTLIPELEFDLDGPGALLEHLEARIRHKHHAVIVIAEGAGQHLLEEDERIVDASGNVKHGDIGVYLKNRINRYFKERNLEVNLKYFDPSYMLRSLPANANDRIFAADLARFAVHAAMAGKTDLMIGRRFNQYIHVPIPIAVATRKKISLESEIWMAVLQATGQPSSLQSRNRT
ncbi:ATP-dependent 6-phosphofructokinase [Sulfidibacter corallicola]|uniref:ATP-dependent 6-phosphofructokinase n=1 Tax=Sulfidibacter corallicola TaxID=2818388 RepID=A0A8A4TSC0_SULCO|nr:ATP-dependent 6-phosphofructokinase [Sulfidibacter corallicola]QTD51952.1 ATP-dependent 6-phosphofructokinase [Sulfidibacter corallicola]